MEQGYNVIGMSIINIVRSGLTLVELLVVMGIVAILVSAVVVINIPTTLERSRDGERKSELEAIRQALELYRYDNGGYPSGSNDVQIILAGLVPTYIASLPNDPVSSAKGFYYRYQSAGTCSGTPSVCTRYNLCSLLEDSAAATVCGNMDCDNSPATDCNYQVTNP